MHKRTTKLTHHIWRTLLILTIPTATNGTTHPNQTPNPRPTITQQRPAIQNSYLSPPQLRPDTNAPAQIPSPVTPGKIEPGGSHRYNLRSRGKPVFAVAEVDDVNTSEEEAIPETNPENTGTSIAVLNGRVSPARNSEPQTPDSDSSIGQHSISDHDDDEDSQSHASYPVMGSELHIGIVQTPFGEMRVAFDSFSAVNLVCERFLPDNLVIEQGKPLSLRGIGGLSKTSGRRTEISFSHRRHDIRIKAYIAPVPYEVDLLIGFPTMNRLGCILDMTTSRPRIFFGGIRTPLELHPLSDIVWELGSYPILSQSEIPNYLSEDDLSGMTEQT